MNAPLIRPMLDADLETVLRIERASFSVPWTPATFHGLLRREDAILRVADEAGAVVGYAVVWLVPDQAELGDIAVDPDWRGRGLGRALLEHMIGLVARRGARELYLEVRVSNEGARRLYERYGFVEVGLRRNYYTNPREDAKVLLLRIPQPPVGSAEPAGSTGSAASKQSVRSRSLMSD